MTTKAVAKQTSTQKKNATAGAKRSRKSAGLKDGAELKNQSNTDLKLAPAQSEPVL